ncbi:MAG: hypothetical protein ABJA02_12040, partial [Acidobacteriota bacterium]
TKEAGPLTHLTAGLFVITDLCIDESLYGCTLDSGGIASMPRSTGKKAERNSTASGPLRT